jgi:hypothetical protein
MLDTARATIQGPTRSNNTRENDQDVPRAFRHNRLRRETKGFWLGGAALAVVGCIVGALMPYRHPVAVALSVLWWGLYFGCFGGSIGALIGLFMPPRRSDQSQSHHLTQSGDQRHRDRARPAPDDAANQ